MLKRPAVNFLVDAFAFVCFVFLTTTGILMHYILPPGTGGARSTWGLGRHDWGAIHFWLAVAFLAALAVHLILHWRWITAMVRGRSREIENPRPRVAFGLVSLVGLLALAVAPLLTPVGPGTGKEAGHGGRESASAQAEAAGPGRGKVEGPEADSKEHAIRGYLTLREVAEQQSLAVDDLKRELKLPADFPLDERLGPMQGRYGYSMDRVNEVVRLLQQNSRPARDGRGK